ncbi:TPA: TetR/AcrR family transcriptional regulator [Vibrio vulnificus]|nr:TetR/AcrR family transcriptional regulator [Vibrio vulnificus]
MAYKKFDIDDVLDKAVTLFWRYGFTTTSMQQIVQATGLKPGSIYHEFGNKEALFKRALSRYTEQSIAATTATLTTQESVLEGIKTILRMLTKEAKNQEYCGCFLIKSQLELSASNDEINKYCIEQLRRIEANYCEFLNNVFDAKTASMYAQQLMLVIFGIRVYAYQYGREQALNETYQSLLPWL